jgi:pimeloyl-ACP methyl ester carboxylesterase
MLLHFAIAILVLAVLYLAFSPRGPLILPYVENTILRDDGKPHPRCLLTDLEMIDAGKEIRWFPSLDGKRKLYGWLFHNTNNQTSRVILFCQGRSSCVADGAAYIRWMLEAGHSVFVFDYRGVGRSPGHATFRSIREDAVAAFDFLRSIGYHSIGVYGQSLGSWVAAYVAQQRAGQVKALCLQSGGDDMRAIARQRSWIMRPYPAFLFWQPPMNNISLVAKAHLPILIIHGEKDDTTYIDEKGEVAPGFPPDCSKRIYAAAHQPKKLYLLPNSSHKWLGDTDHDLYMKALQELATMMNEGEQLK